MWVDFFQQHLAGEGCQSQLLLTTQAVPEALEVVGARYPRCWSLQAVGGLSENEQLALFTKNGLSPDERGAETLKRLGSLYDGHPLVLQVIAKDILSKPFNGNVQQYWQHYQAEFNEEESDRRQGQSSRALQLRVKQRVEASLKRLPSDGLQMVRRAAVYRCPVPERLWLQLVGELPEARQWSALEVLRSHNLVEEEFRGDGVLLLRQHNLVKGVARRLLRAEAGEWRGAHQTAVQVWLRDYEPEVGAPNLEQLRGKLEAFHHHCEAEDWEAAKGILINEGVGNQLYTWSYYWEMLPLYGRLLGRLGSAVDMACEKSIGNAYYFVGSYPKAIEHYQQSIETARKIGDRQGEGRVLGNLGLAYERLGNYAQAIEYHQQCLSIAREIGDRQGEGNASGNLGIALLRLEQYPEAQPNLQSSLGIFKALGFRAGEAEALLRLAELYHQAGHPNLALDHCTQALDLSMELGIPLLKECEALLATLPAEGGESA